MHAVVRLWAVCRGYDKVGKHVHKTMTRFISDHIYRVQIFDQKYDGKFEVCKSDPI